MIDSKWRKLLVAARNLQRAAKVRYDSHNFPDGEYVVSVDEMGDLDEAIAALAPDAPTETPPLTTSLCGETPGHAPRGCYYCGLAIDRSLERRSS